MNKIIDWIMDYFWRRTHKPEREGWKISSEERKKPRIKPLLILKRKEFTRVSTIGDLYYDDIFQCRILEDTWRDPDESGQLDEHEKVYGKTAIPIGTYRVILSFSERFQKITPELLEVKFFSGIRFHSGNKAVDTKGCLLTGKTHAKDIVLESREAYKSLMRKLVGDCQSRKVFIDIVNVTGETFERTG